MLRCYFRLYKIAGAISYIPFLQMSHNGKNFPLTQIWVKPWRPNRSLKLSKAASPVPHQAQPSRQAQRVSHLGWEVDKVTTASQTMPITSSRESRQRKRHLEFCHLSCWPSTLELHLSPRV